MPWFAEKLIKMKNKDDEFSVKIINILSRMSMAQKVVSTATPIVGAVATSDDANDAYEVSAVWPATAALFPRWSASPASFHALQESEPDPSVDDFVQKRLGNRRQPPLAGGPLCRPLPEGRRVLAEPDRRVLGAARLYRSGGLRRRRRRRDRRDHGQPARRLLYARSDARS